jgi:uncharacterized protein (TIGR01619 family)
MTENWDSYFCTVDALRASIVVNLALAEVAPLAELPVLGYVSLTLARPDAEGFPDDEEEAELARMEDSLLERFADGDEGLCAGHCLTDGRLDVFWYLPREAETLFPRQVETVMAAYPDAQWETGAHADPNWELYFTFLFPDQSTLIHIQNRRALENLLEQGDDLSRSRLVEHWLEFANETDAQAFIKTAEALDYAFKDLSPNDDPDDDEAPAGDAPTLLLTLTRPDAPEDLDDLVPSLHELALEHKGRYLGWSCLPI